jgi:hypothetical protein
MTSIHPHLRLLQAFAALASLALAPAAGAQNLLDNPGFDVDLSGWEMLSGRPSSWMAEDVFGDPASGSVLITHDEASAGGYRIILRQCHPIAGPGNFRIRGYLRNLPDQPVPGNAAIIVAPARNADCTGGFGNSTGPASSTGSNWQYREWDFVVSHATVAYQAIMVNLAILKTVAVSTPRSAMFDQIELLSLDLPDAIFLDGFEEAP